ncbi:MAG TPA: hypothetical protein VL068_00625 [Microthrixaceae bacterium]|nr:hypothetical protein [Microthrixaceae bacterium]
MATLALLAVTVTSCGDGSPAFCKDLTESKMLAGVVAALKEGDLKKATEEAKQLKDLAGDAPTEIRADMTALADGVADIIDLVRRDNEANSVAEKQRGKQRDRGQDTATDPGAGVPEDTSGDESVTKTTIVEPTDVDQRRAELNSRLGTLDKRSENVSNWALEQCGLEL